MNICDPFLKIYVFRNKWPSGLRDSDRLEQFGVLLILVFSTDFVDKSKHWTSPAAAINKDLREESRNHKTESQILCLFNCKASQVIRLNQGGLGYENVTTARNLMSHLRLHVVTLKRCYQVDDHGLCMLNEIRKRYSVARNNIILIFFFLNDFFSPSYLSYQVWQIEAIWN